MEVISPSLSLDAAKPDPNALPLGTLEALMSDMRSESPWRTRAAKECDYYDNNQLSPDDIAKAQERNLPTIIVNLIAPTVNLILGMEARTRTDWVVKTGGTGDGLTSAQADGLSAKLNEAERNTHADQACADAYASQVKAGLGWVEVSRNANPFLFRYRVCAVDRAEIWWDMRAKDRLLKDARWLVRRKWQDVDALKAMVSEDLHPFIDAAMNTQASWDQSQFVARFPYLQDDLIGREWLSDSTEWRDSDRNRACAYEVWYRVWKRGPVIKYPDGRAEEFNQQNPMHLAAIATGMAQVVVAAYQKMRLSWWVGPFRLYDIPSPLEHDDFPYTPFWGYIEDATRTPYGVIRSMMSLQDEVNARRAKMMWQLAAVRVVAEEDAVDDHDAAAAEISRPDAYIVLNKNRKKAPGQKAFDVQEHQGMNAQQFQIYEDATQRMQQVGGVYAPMLGDASAGADAGVAIDMLIQQGTTGLAGINSNYKFSRTNVGEKLLAMVLKDMHGQTQKVNLPDGAASMKKSVTFNRARPPAAPGGAPVVENDTRTMLYKVALADQPSTPAYQQQRMKDLVEFAKSMPEQLQAVFADMVVMASDIPNKAQIAARIRQLTGQQPAVDPETATQEELAEAQAAQAAAAKQQQVQDMAQKIEMAQGQAKADKDTAAAGLARANTALSRLQAVSLALEMNLVPGQSEPAEVEESEAEGDGFGKQTPKADNPQVAAAAMQTAASAEPHHTAGNGDRLSLHPDLVPM